jgi:hypothetical protein
MGEIPTESSVVDDVEQSRDGENDMPWVAVAEATQVGARKELNFVYDGDVLTIVEPESLSELEHADGWVPEDTPRRKSDRYRKESEVIDRLADLCLLVGGVPHREVYAVKLPKGDKLILDTQTAAEYGLDLEALAAGADSASGVEAVQYWEDCPAAKRRRIGEKIANFIAGDVDQ